MRAQRPVGHPVGGKPFRQSKRVDILDEAGTGRTWSTVTCVWWTLLQGREYEKAAEEGKADAGDYPDLKVMCCLSTEGIKAAADVVKARGQAVKVKVIGLGLPDQMEDYVGSDREGYMPCAVHMESHGPGKVAGYVCLELSEGH